MTDLTDRLRNRSYRLATRDMNGDGASLALEAARRIEALETCLGGCLHFDDGYVRNDTLGNALHQWRNEARKLLGVE